MSEKPVDHHWYQNTKADDTETITITLWPYRSLSITGFRFVMLAFAVAILALGFGFFILGAWPVVGFLGVEIGVVWYAFRVNYRSGQLVETIKIGRKDVQIKRTDWRGREHQHKLASPWVEAVLIPTNADKDKLVLRHHADHFEIGSFLPPIEKPPLARALNNAFSRMRQGARS